MVSSIIKTTELGLGSRCVLSFQLVEVPSVTKYLFSNYYEESLCSILPYRFQLIHSHLNDMIHSVIRFRFGCINLCSVGGKYASDLRVVNSTSTQSHLDKCM